MIEIVAETLKERLKPEYTTFIDTCDGFTSENGAFHQNLGIYIQSVGLCSMTARFTSSGVITIANDKMLLVDFKSDASHTFNLNDPNSIDELAATINKMKHY